MMNPLIFFGIVFLLAALILVVSPFILSSRISREEEDEHRDTN